MRVFSFSIFIIAKNVGVMHIKNQDNIRVHFVSMSEIKSSKHSGKGMTADETGVNSPSMAQSHLFRASVHGNF